MGRSWRRSRVQGNEHVSVQTEMIVTGSRRGNSHEINELYLVQLDLATRKMMG